MAVVTGAAVGIGRATSLLLAREGAKVAVTDVQDEKGRKVVGEIEQEGGTTRYWHLDVGDENQVARVMLEIVGALGQISVLVNNAGISGVNKPTHEIEEEEWDAVQRSTRRACSFARSTPCPP